MEFPSRFVEDRWFWCGALGCFVLAGLTGAFYRFAVGYGVTAGLDLGNVRHAHSHLMYLGWVTPALFVLIARQLSAYSGRASSRVEKGVIGAALAAAFLAYPLFLAFGYRSVALGEARVPLAAAASGLNMLVWYAFVVLYRRARRGLASTRALLFWDVALGFLVVATLGAWSLTLLTPLGVDDPVWATALTHLFLDLFSEGWFVLAMLGVAYAVLQPPGRAAGHWSLWLICAGLPVTFALGMPETLVPPALHVLARAGSMVAAVGILVNVWILWLAVAGERRWLWRIPLALLAVKLAAQLVVAVWPGVWWAALHNLRVLYLHLMVLGFVTLGLVAGAAQVWGRAATRGRVWMYGAVLALIASLLPLTPLWPAAWRGAWVLSAAAWISLGPVGAAAWMLVRSFAGTVEETDSAARDAA